MEMKTLLSIGKVALTLVNIAVTAYEVKKVVTEVAEKQKEKLDEKIEQGVREKTGNPNFNLKEYREAKVAKDNKLKVNVDVKLDGLKPKLFVRKNIIKFLLTVILPAALYSAGAVFLGYRSGHEKGFKDGMDDNFATILKANDYGEETYA